MNLIGIFFHFTHSNIVVVVPQSFDLLELYVCIWGKILWLTINSSLIALITMHGPTADSN